MGILVLMGKMGRIGENTPVQMHCSPLGYSKRGGRFFPPLFKSLPCLYVSDASTRDFTLSSSSLAFVSFSAFI